MDYHRNPRQVKGREEENQTIKENGNPSTLLLFLCLSWAGLWVLFGIGKWLAIRFLMNLGAPGGLFLLIAAALPSIRAIVAVVVCEKGKGIRRPMQRSLEWRFSPFWYLVAILIPFAANGINALIAMVFLGVEAPPNWFVPDFGPVCLLFFLVYNGFGEEIGWRRLALPRLQRRFGSLGGDLAVGVLWALWHLP